MGKTRKITADKKPVVANDTAPESKWRNTFIVTGIVIYTLILFSGSVNHQFVTWDDPDYITQNMLIRDLSWNGIVKIFTTPVIGMYNPLPFLVYAIEYKLWGLDAKPYNWVSLFLHLFATVLMYRFSFRLTKRWETAAIVAILFAIHPMHVSVVTWASQIKTSLFIIFFFLGLTTYMDYLEDGFKKRYMVLVCLYFILACLSKPSAVTFAPLLLLVDWYLRRKPGFNLLIEKIPVFAIALGFGILTLLTHGEEGDSIFEVNRQYSLINNMLVSNYAIVFYIEKLFYPKNLCLIYPYPGNDKVLPLQYYLAIPVIPLIAYGIYKAGAFRRELLFGVMFFIIAISVLLRIVPSGFFGMANRYSYLSFTGLFFIIGQFYVYVKE